MATTTITTRYSVHTDGQAFVVADAANGQRPVQDPEAGGPLVFGSFEDAEWYCGELRGLRTPSEIRRGI